MGGINSTPVQWMAQSPAEGGTDMALKAYCIIIRHLKGRKANDSQLVLGCNFQYQVSLISPLHKHPQKWNKAFKLSCETMADEYQNSVFLLSLSVYPKSNVPRAILWPAANPILPARNDKRKQRCQVQMCTQVLSRMAKSCLIISSQVTPARDNACTKVPIAH